MNEWIENKDLDMNTDLFPSPVNVNKICQYIY